MKKIIALLLVAVLAVSLVACDKAPADETKDTTATKPQGSENNTQTPAPASAVEVLETVWALYNEETEKFPALGGFKLDEEGIPSSTEGAPGLVEDADYLSGTSLLVPVNQTANIAETASLIHAMNTNFFTGAAYKLVDGAGAKAFATAMQTAIQGNRWMCGAPEQLIIANVGGYVVVAYGKTDTMSVFQTHLNTAYAGAEVLVNEAIGG